MGGKHCRLYDENLVHNIMISTGLSLLDFFKQNRNASTEEICEFVEVNANHIIEDTIEHLNTIDNMQEKEGGDTGEGEENWPFDEDDGNPPHSA